MASVPKLDELAAEPLLAALAVLDRTLVLVARAVRAAHPDVDRVARPGDPPPTAAARDLVDECDLALRALDAYRDQGYARLYRRDRDPDWPF